MAGSEKEYVLKAYKELSSSLLVAFVIYLAGWVASAAEVTALPFTFFVGVGTICLISGGITTHSILSRMLRS